MTESFYWYDFETTGTNPILDRPLQFAGIRTDIDLNEIGEPKNILSRPGGDVVPNPEAILVTGIRMSDIVREGLSERDFASDVLAEFSQPQSCVVGFNSLRFDDEFTRQMLYRNFFDPYGREWQGGNSRWDLIDLLRAAYALRPDGIEWPVREDGSPIFRLEQVTALNGIEHTDAHDALADVRATIALARLLKQAQPKLYDYAYRLRDKKAVLQQLYPLGKQAVVHIASVYPASRGCVGVILPICQHPTNANAVICFDLTQSPEALLAANPSEIQRLLFSKRDALAAHEERLALSTIQVNRCPFIAPMATLGDRASNFGIDLAVCEDHMSQLKGAAGLVEKIQDAFSRRQFDESDDPDFQLYQGGFTSEADKTVMRELLAGPIDRLADYHGRFQDPRFDEMLFRFRARNYPQTLSDSEQTRWHAYLQTRWAAGDSPTAVLNVIESSMVDCDEATRVVLRDLAVYTQNLLVNE